MPPSAKCMTHGSGISVVFDKMRADAGEKARGHDCMRCDMILNFAAKLDAPVTIQMDVRGGIDRIKINLSKGTQQLGLSFEAFAKGEFPNSTALIAIDSLEAVFESKP